LLTDEQVLCHGFTEKKTFSPFRSLIFFPVGVKFYLTNVKMGVKKRTGLLKYDSTQSQPFEFIDEAASGDTQKSRGPGSVSPGLGKGPFNRIHFAFLEGL
jgi:hypothetical protein